MVLTPDTLEIFSPSGQKFFTPVEINQLRQQERQAKETALEELEQERQKYQDLLTQLREKEINPEQL